MDWIYEPWPWYFSGPLIGLMVPVLLLFGNKHFGISSTFKHICAMCIPFKVNFFSYDWKKESWSLFIIFGILIGSFFAANYLVLTQTPVLSDGIISILEKENLSIAGLAPESIFSMQSLLSLNGFIFIIVGGFLVGFGTRWANGCTSGHAIMGLSLLNPGSLVAVIGFFIGGLITTHLILPLLF